MKQQLRTSLITAKLSMYLSLLGRIRIAKSKSAARRDYKADSSMSRRDKLSKLVWGD
ncbi:MAG: hypothetical protein ACI4GW_13085 [Lachnospiraceae bacterium]